MFLSELEPHDFNFRGSIVCFNVGQDSPTQRFFSQIFFLFMIFSVTFIYFKSRNRVVFFPSFIES